jgi:hypothetical protein
MAVKLNNFVEHLGSLFLSSQQLKALHRSAKQLSLLQKVRCITSENYAHFCHLSDKKRAFAKIRATLSSAFRGLSLLHNLVWLFAKIISA